MSDIDIGRLAARIGADLSEWEEATRQMETDMQQAESVARSSAEEISDQFNQVGQTMQNVGMAMTKFISIPLAGLGGLALYTAGEFEKAMKRTEAITGAAGDALEGLEMQARQLGETTVYSATEAAQGMSYLAMAGFEVNEIMGALPSVLNMAAAGQFELARASDIASDVVRAFGAEAKETARISDVMTKAFITANIELGPLGNALSFAAPVAHSFGMSIEETVAALAALSDAGIKSGRAGRTLRIILTQLARQSDNLGLNIRNADGSMRSFADMIEELEKSAIRADEMTAQFGARAGAGLPILLEKGSQGLRDYTKVLEDSGGTAQYVAEKQLEGLAGQLVKLGSAFAGLQIAISDTGMLEMATILAEKLTELTRWAAALDKETLRWTTGMLAGVVAMGPMMTGIGWITKAMSVLIGKKVAATRALMAFNSVLLATPWAAVLAGVAAVAGGYVWYSRRLERANDQTNRQTRELTALVLRITDTNTEQQERNQLIEELQREYPDFLKNIDAESASNEQLAKRLKEVNKERADLLEIQGLQSWVSERRTKAEEAEEQAILARIRLTSRLADAISELGLEQEAMGKSLEEQTQLVFDAASAERDFLIPFTESKRLYDSVRKARMEYSKAQQDATQATEELTQAERSFQKRFAQSADVFVKFTDIGDDATAMVRNFGLSLVGLQENFAEFDPKAEKLTKLQDEIGKIEDAYNDQIATIERTAQVYDELGREYDVTEEKTKAVEQAIDSLIGIGLTSAFPVMQDFMEEWAEFNDILGDSVDPIKDIREELKGSLADIRAHEAVYAMLGKEYDATQKRADEVKKALVELHKEGEEGSKIYKKYRDEFERLQRLLGVHEQPELDIDVGPAVGSIAYFEEQARYFWDWWRHASGVATREYARGMAEAMDANAHALREGEYAFVEYSDNISTEVQRILSNLNLIEQWFKVDFPNSMDSSKFSWEEFLDVTREMGQAVQRAFQRMVSEIDRGEQGLESMAATALNTARKIIGAKIATGIAAAVSSALSDTPFPLNLVLAPMAGAAAGAIFAAAVPKLGFGGDVTQAGVFEVGERGREHVFLPAGAAVRPNDSSSMKVEVDVSGTLVGRGDTLEAVIENVVNRRMRTARA